MGIVVTDHDPGWAAWFEAESSELARALAAWLTDGIHHVGSTAVPGLAAKPILDMIAGVRDLTEAASVIPVLRDLSYAHAPHRPRALWFYKPASAGPHQHTCHLHLTEPGSDLWRERLAFRDALRTDPDLARQYQELKQRLARVRHRPERLHGGQTSIRRQRPGPLGNRTSRSYRSQEHRS